MTMHHLKKYDDIIDEIYDEIEGAQTYVKHALMFKAEDKPLSEMYYNMARQEYNHAINLIEHAPKIAMMDDTLKLMWERDHGRIVEWLSDVKSHLDMIRE